MGRETTFFKRSTQTKPVWKSVILDPFKVTDRNQRWQQPDTKRPPPRTFRRETLALSIHRWDRPLVGPLLDAMHTKNKERRLFSFTAAVYAANVLFRWKWEERHSFFSRGFRRFYRTVLRLSADKRAVILVIFSLETAVRALPVLLQNKIKQAIQRWR